MHAHGFQDKELHAHQNPAAAKNQRKLVSCVETFTAFMLGSTRIKDREHKLACLKEEIALLKDLGELAEARDTQRKLRALLK